MGAFTAVGGRSSPLAMNAAVGLTAGPSPRSSTNYTPRSSALSVDLPRISHAVPTRDPKRFRAVTSVGPGEGRRTQLEASRDSTSSESGAAIVPGSPSLLTSNLAQGAERPRAATSGAGPGSPPLDLAGVSRMFSGQL